MLGSSGYVPTSSDRHHQCPNRGLTANINRIQRIWRSGYTNQLWMLSQPIYQDCRDCSSSLSPLEGVGRSTNHQFIPLDCGIFIPSSRKNHPLSLDWIVSIVIQEHARRLPLSEIQGIPCWVRKAAYSMPSATGYMAVLPYILSLRGPCGSKSPSNARRHCPRKPRQRVRK
jgi:hypothetical protein